MTDKGVLRLIGRIAATNGMAVDRDTLEAQRGEWSTLLAGLDDEQGDAALTAALQETKFPAPSDILRHAGGGGSATNRAELAWEDAYDKSGSVGAYRSPTFADPLTSRVIRSMGGWVDFCKRPGPTHWVRKEFMEIYENLAATAGGQIEPIRTPGIFEGQPRRPAEGLEKIQPPPLLPPRDEEAG